jgi:hypothetical protein
MDMMQIYIEPDFSIPFPLDPIPLSDFREKAEAACKTLEFLGIEPEVTLEDQEAAEQAVYNVATEDEKALKKLVKQDHKPAVYYTAKGILDEFSVRVVENAAQIRLLVTNKLLIESENPDPKIRLRSLELLGKITDVGLFTEKSEVTVNHRSTTELVDSIRNKIQKLMYPEDIKEGEIVEAEFSDLDKEMGFDDVSSN